VSAGQVGSEHHAEARRHAELLELVSARLPDLPPARARDAALMLGWSEALAEQPLPFGEYQLLVSGQDLPRSLLLVA
jgi:hypothetical protein